MKITLKDALRSLISCENKYGRRSMILTWGEQSRCSKLCVCAEKMARKIHTRPDLLIEHWSRFWNEFIQSSCSQFLRV